MIFRKKLIYICSTRVKTGKNFLLTKRLSITNRSHTRSLKLHYFIYNYRHSQFKIRIQTKL